MASCSLSNRRLLIGSKRTLIDFDDCSFSFVANKNVKSHATIPAPVHDLIAKTGKLLCVTKTSNKPGFLSFSLLFQKPVSLVDTPLLCFAFSAYDGIHDSQYFEDLSENKIFPNPKDDALIAFPLLSVSLLTNQGEESESIVLTNFGFNRCFFNFLRHQNLKEVYGLRFDFSFTCETPGWHGDIFIDNIEIGKEMDFQCPGALLNTFTCQGGSIQKEGESLLFSFSNGTVLENRTLSFAKETIYDVELSVKNTIEIVADSSSPLSFRLFYATEESPDFILSQSKIFHFSGHPYERLLCTFPHAKGRLTGFRLQMLSGGKVRIHKIGFEHEELHEESCSLLSCRAKNNALSFEGVAAPHEKIQLYRTFPHLLGKDTFNAKNLLGDTTADSQGHYCIRVSAAKNGNYLYSSQFIARGSEGRFSNRVELENWRDLPEGTNPYSFAVPNRDFLVTDSRYGAKGDGYHNDNDAIQKAIDDASVSGGKVILPVGVYRIQSLVIRSGVELHFEEGAVLYQDDVLSHYKKLPYFGHNASLSGVNWPANSRCGNYPLIYAHKETNIKLTGKGVIRMCDEESKSLDGHFRFIGEGVCIGCCDRIHMTPIGFTNCSNVEITDVKIIRSSAANIVLKGSRRCFVANVDVDEVKCTGADGIWVGAGQDIKIVFCRFNINDDGVVLGATYQDPRDFLWILANPGSSNNGVRRLLVDQCYFYTFEFTGNAISFCPWGTDDPLLENEAIQNVVITNTILQGCRSIGGYLDNPYFGKQPFDGNEAEDYSPIYELRIEHNEYWSPVCLSTSAPVHGTSWITDCGLHSSAQFLYGDFLRRMAERKPGWKTGLSNWSGKNLSFSKETVFLGKNCACIAPPEGKSASLYQGLYLPSGQHTFNCSIALHGKACLFVRDARNRQNIVRRIEEGNDEEFRSCRISFYLPSDKEVQVGIEIKGGQRQKVYLTDCRIED